MTAWNEYSPERLEGLLRWVNQRGRPAAIVILPESVDPWLCVGEIMDAVSDEAETNSWGVSSTCGATDYSSRDANVYVYTLPNEES